MLQLAGLVLYLAGLGATLAYFMIVGEHQPDSPVLKYLKASELRMMALILVMVVGTGTGLILLTGMPAAGCLSCIVYVVLVSIFTGGDMINQVAGIALILVGLVGLILSFLVTEEIVTRKAIAWFWKDAYRGFIANFALLCLIGDGVALFSQTLEFGSVAIALTGVFWSLFPNRLAGRWLRKVKRDRSRQNGK